MVTLQSIPATGLLATALLTSIVSAQNVGIGTTTPKSKLSVNGSTASGGLAIGDSGYTSTTGIVAPLNGAIIQGFTGIGTTAPVHRLHLQGANTQVYDSAIMIEETGPVAGGSNPATTPGVYLRVSDAANLNVGDVYGQIYFQSIAPGAGATGSNTGMASFHRGLLPGNPDPLTALGFATSSGTGSGFRMILNEDGNLGIGTMTPIAPLHVAAAKGIQQTNVTGRYFVFNSTTDLNHVDNVTGPNAASAIFQTTVWSGGAFVAFTGSLTASDARLKNVIGRSDSAKDLATLEKIEVTDYTMKDVVKMGNAPVKKVVAQQVEAIYPAAVKTIGYKGFTFTPDIYELSSSVKSDGGNGYTIGLAKAHGLKEGETVRLITEKNAELDVVAQVVNDTTFTTTTKEAVGDKVFVYGKQCLDLKSVDYDAIAMLNVSATQELARKVAALETENAELKARGNRIASLESENAKLRDQTGELAARLEALEKSMAALPTAAAVALTKN